MNKAVKTLLLWAFLVACFVLVYRISIQRADEMTWEPWVLPLPVITMVVFLVVQTKRGRRGVADNAEGARLLERGRVYEALQKFEGALATADQMAYRFNIAIAQLRLHRVLEAIRGFEYLLAKRGPTKDFRSMIEQQLACARAIAGQDRAKGLPVEMTADDPISLLTRAILACRGADFAAAEALLQRQELKQLGGYHRAFAETLAAWCAFEMRAESLPIDEATLFGEAGQDGLREAWPQLVAFLDRRSLASVSAAAMEPGRDATPTVDRGDL